jgi:hypothetical protein
MTTTTNTTDAGLHILSALTGPQAPRALLVSLERNGELELTPVDHGQAVVNLDTELHDHLSASPRSTEWLLALRDYCDSRLAALAEAHATGGFTVPRADGGWDIAHINAFGPLVIGGAL